MRVLTERLLGAVRLREGSLTALAMRGAFWTVTGFGLQYALKLISTLFLTRLLNPDAFGLMSLAAVVLTGLNLLSDIGTTPSVIRSQRGDEPEFLRTAWTLQAGRGVIIAACACLLAWPAAQLYDEPLLFPMIVALSITTLLQGLSSIALPLAQRNMALRQITLLDISVQAITTVATILLAWLLQSVWALVLGALCGSTLRLMLSHLVLPPFPHAFRLERDAVSEILTFGRWILLATLLTFLGGKGIDAIRGTLVPVDMLGMLVLAGTISWALGDLVGKLLGNIAFPALSRILRERPQDAARNLRKIQFVLVMGALPGFLLLSFVANDLIGLMYDDRYAMAGSFLMVLALGSAAGTLSMPYQNTMLALGESRVHAIVMGSAAALKIAGTVIGFHLGGMIWMLAALGFAEIVVMLIAARFAHRRGLANLRLDAAALAILAVAYALALPVALSMA